MSAGLSHLRAWLEGRAARGYVAEDLDGALDLARQLDTVGVACTIGYWDGPGAPADRAAGAAHRTLDRLDGLDAVVAVKSPPLLADAGAAVAARALGPVRAGVRLVVDAPAPDHADGAVALALALAHEGWDTGLALCGRWRRSVDDAELAVEHDLAVRLVKGEHPDPSGDGPAPAEGFVALAAQLAGRARHVGVASHDIPVARAALESLEQAGTACELELLLGLPVGVSAVAAELGVGQRAYVPWGTRAWVPYEVTTARHDPEMTRRLLGDAVAGRRRWSRTLSLRAREARARSAA